MRFRGTKIYSENKALIYSLLFLVVYSTTIVFAAPPTSPYTPQDNITNPTCAPTDTNCFVSLFPDQASNAGKLLFTDGTSPAWASNLYWDETNDRLGVGTNNPQAALHVVGDVIASNVYNSGLEWTTRASAADVAWGSVAYGNGMFVAVGPNAVMTSVDGITWTSRTPANSNSWSSVTYGNGMFVAVSQDGTGNRVMTSVDGITWTIRTSASDQSWTDVTYGKGMFVAVSNSGDASMYSYDGVTWANGLGDIGNDRDWREVTYGNGIFVAVGSKPNTDNIATSTDGITWTLRSKSTTNQLIGVTYGNGKFVAVGYTGTNNRVVTSPDGITWTTQTTPVDNLWLAVTYGNGVFVAVSQDGTGNRVMTSFDGVNWTTRSTPVDNQWRAITYGNGVFVSVAITGTGNRVMTSGKPYAIPFSHNNTYQGGLTAKGLLSVTGFGSTSSTYTAQFHNSTGTSNSLVIRDDGRVGIGTASPSGLLDVQGGKVNIGGSYVAGTSSDFFALDINPTLDAGANNQRISLVRLRHRVASNGVFTGIERPLLIVEEGGGGVFPIQLFNTGLRIGGGYSATSSIVTPSANIELKGFGASSATYTMKVTNSALAETFSIRDSAQVGVGTFSPAFKLDIFEDSASTYAARIFNDGNNDNRWGLLIQAGADTASAGRWIQFNDGDGTSIGTISLQTGTLTLTTTSDQRLKHNVTDTVIGLNALRNIKVRDFSFISDATNRTVHGFIAQELYEAYPDAVMVPEDPNAYWQVSYSQLTPLIIKSIQDLDIKVQPLTDIIKDDPLIALRMNTFFKDVLVSIEDGIAYIKSIRSDRVETKELCVDDVCVTRDQFLNLIQGGGYSGGGSTPTPDPTEETPEPEEEEEIVDEPALEEQSSPGEETPAPESETETTEQVQ